jgi:hypothetical protein
MTDPSQLSARTSEPRCWECSVSDLSDSDPVGVDSLPRDVCERTIKSTITHELLVVNKCDSIFCVCMVLSGEGRDTELCSNLQAP